MDLPSRLHKEFEKSGPAATVFDEVRNAMRVNCRGSSNRAGLELRQSLPAFPRIVEWQAVYVTNISKKGCGLIHSQILYPGERFTLTLLTGLKRTVEIVWCRRINANCFELGTRFAETIPCKSK